MKKTLAALIFLLCVIPAPSRAQEETKKPVIEQPVTVNGDTVEYMTDSKEVSAVGNVRVDYHGTKLRCEELRVDTLTKEAYAKGNVRIEDASSVLTGREVQYNFETQKGTVLGAAFRSDPYYGRSDKIEKTSADRFISYNGTVTTCGLDHPHYNVRSRKVVMVPREKISASTNTLTLAGMPLAYLPWYSHSLKDPFMHVQLMPGHSKQWGSYLQSAWRYNLAGNIDGRIYLDYRERLGLGEGFGYNYRSSTLGKGDLKVYYAHEEDKEMQAGQPDEFQRALVRWRHQWDIDPATNLVSEFYRITDSKRMLLGSDYNILKDYFPREYEKDTQPLSYTLIHHNFSHSSIDAMVQKRTNRWYSQTEKLPEVKYNLPSLQLGSSPFYFEDITQGANFNSKSAVPSESSSDISVNRFDTYNKLSLPAKLAFVEVSPYVASRQTYYSTDADDASVSPRTVFYSGTNLSTKFYRIFDLNAAPLGVEINGLRHVITPTVGYAYNNAPTIGSWRLKQFDAVDAIGKSNAATLELTNKLQTKRDKASVDLATLRLNCDYNFYKFDPATNLRTDDYFGDLLAYLNLLPYSWLRLDADSAYNHHSDYFSNANYDVQFSLAPGRSVGIGQRYQRKGANEVTFSTHWRLTPKWSFRIYERYQHKDIPDVRKGFVVQELTLSRDLHCWTLDLSYTSEKEQGNTIWMIFRLKAFPEAEINFSTSYNQPNSGAQTNP